MPISTTVETLTQIWQRVLARRPIGLEENFFDLGGNDSLADLVFAEIACAFGGQLPSATIRHSPTIASLAAFLDQPGLAGPSPLVQMKRGSEKPPVFIVHGLGGRAAELYELVRHIRTEHSIYGIQAKGFDGLEEPLDRIEDMAGVYLDAMEAIEPCGPYLLIGYSFGGLVAFEMAQQLSHAGKQVALLTLLDAYPDERSLLLPAQRLLLIAQRVKFHLEAMLRRPVSEVPQYFASKLEARRRRSTLQNGGGQQGEIRELSFAQASLRMEQRANVAMANYRPERYRGKINFVMADGTTSYFVPPDPTIVWKRFAQEFELSKIPGDHLEMVSIRSESLASVLTRHIREAISSLDDTGLEKPDSRSRGPNRVNRT